MRKPMRGLRDRNHRRRGGGRGGDTKKFVPAQIKPCVGLTPRLHIEVHVHQAFRQLLYSDGIVYLKWACELLNLHLWIKWHTCIHWCNVEKMMKCIAISRHFLIRFPDWMCLFSTCWRSQVGDQLTYIQGHGSRQLHPHHGRRCSWMKLWHFWL